MSVAVRVPRRRKDLTSTVATGANAAFIREVLEPARVFRVVPARRLTSGTLVTAKLELGVTGAAGAVHLEVALNWYVDEHPAHARLEHPPQGTGLYLHRRTAVGLNGFPVPGGRCEWLEFEPCFPESLSFVLAADLALDLRDRGDEAVWALLEQLYRERLG